MILEELTIVVLTLLVQLQGCKVSGQADRLPNKADRSVVSYTDRDLIQSIRDRDAAKVQSLLLAGIDPNAREKADPNQVGETALNIAVHTESTEIVQMLLKHNSDVNAKGYLDRSSLFHARTRSLANILLNAGADPNSRDANGDTPLMHAPYKVAKLLAERGTNVDLPNNEGFTALSVTAEHGEIEKVALLISYGADVNARAKNGWTALIAAGGRNNTEVAELLVRHGADPNDKMSDGFTPLMRAATWNSTKTAQVLLRLGANANAKMNDSTTALSIAVVSNNQYGSHREMIELLKKAGAKE